MKRYDNLFFDFDGTIMDTSEGIFRSFDYALESFGMEKPGPEVYKTLIGPPLIDSFRNAFGFNEEKARLGVKRYREFYAPKGLYMVSVYEGLESSLSALAESGRNLYVATSKPEIFARELLDKHNLLKYFKMAGGSDTDEKRVKKQDIIRYVMEKCGIASGENCLMIGDRKYDAEGASKAGMDCLGVAWGFAEPGELTESGCIAVAETPDSLPSVIKSLESGN